MGERGVDEEEVRTALAHPDYAEPGIKGRVNAFKRIQGRYLRATFREDPGDLLVITVAVRKKAFGRIRTHEDRVQQDR
jgi:hypothetical protein